MDHEAIHVQHYVLAQEWFGKFKAQTKVKDFDEFLQKQPESKISRSDAKTVAGFVEGGVRLGTTEGRAHLGAAMDAAKLGAADEAASAIRNYGDLLRGRRLNNPADASVTELQAQLKATYDGLPDDQRAVFKKALEDAGKDTWLAKVKL